MSFTDCFALYPEIAEVSYLMVPRSESYGVMNGEEVLRMSMEYSDVLRESFDDFAEDVMEFDFDESYFQAYKKYENKVVIREDEDLYTVYKVSNFHDVCRLVSETYYI